MEAKFKIGQKVKAINDSEVCEVLSIHMDSEKIMYTVSSREWDFVEKKVLDGVKNHLEDELEEVVEEEENKDE